MTVDTTVVKACKVSAESKTFHLAKEIWVMGERILERPVSLAGLPHEDAPAFLQYLCVDDSRIVSKIRDTNLTFEHCLHGFTITVGTQ
jgi:hypothetical protein